jgi:hypothetical protein
MGTQKYPTPPPSTKTKQKKKRPENSSVFLGFFLLKKSQGPSTFRNFFLKFRRIFYLGPEFTRFHK